MERPTFRSCPHPIFEAKAFAVSTVGYQCIFLPLFKGWRVSSTLLRTPYDIRRIFSISNGAKWCHPICAPEECLKKILRTEVRIPEVNTLLSMLFNEETKVI
jgi:hypothetical protein